MAKKSWLGSVRRAGALIKQKAGTLQSLSTSALVKERLSQSVSQSGGVIGYGSGFERLQGRGGGAHMRCCNKITRQASYWISGLSWNAREVLLLETYRFRTVLMSWALH